MMCSQLWIAVKLRLLLFINDRFNEIHCFGTGSFASKQWNSLLCCVVVVHWEIEFFLGASTWIVWWISIKWSKMRQIALSGWLFRLPDNWNNFVIEKKMTAHFDGTCAAQVSPLTPEQPDANLFITAKTIMDRVVHNRRWILACKSHKLHAKRVFGFSQDVWRWNLWTWPLQKQMPYFTARERAKVI